MNADAASRLDDLVILGFFGTWAILGILGFVVFYWPRSADFKRTWFPRYVILMGVIFLLVSTWMMRIQSRSSSLPEMYYIEVPMVALISYLNIKFTRFCGKCGATVLDQNWFSPSRFCPKCGAEFATWKEDRLDEV